MPIPFNRNRRGGSRPFQKCLGLGQGYFHWKRVPMKKQFFPSIIVDVWWDLIENPWQKGIRGRKVFRLTSERKDPGSNPRLGVKFLLLIHTNAVDDFGWRRSVSVWQGHCQDRSSSCLFIKWLDSVLVSGLMSTAPLASNGNMQRVMMMMMLC